MANLHTLSILYKTFTKSNKIVYITLALKTVFKSNTISI
jgi:hypothetical protein